MNNRMRLVLAIVVIYLWLPCRRKETAFAAQPLGPATFGNPDHPWGTRRPVTEADHGLIATYRSSSNKSVFGENFFQRRRASIAATIRFSTAVTEYARKIPTNPAEHHLYVNSLRVFALSE
jgi:hypothetical protein